MEHKASLTLVVPGLMPERALFDPELGLDASRTLLARASRVTETGLSDPCALLFELFDIPAPHFGDIPVAAVAAVGEGLSPAEGWWLRADPVNITANRQHLVLMGNQGLELAMAEAQALAEPLRESLEPLGAELTVAHPKRWYLQFAEAPRITTHTLAEALGRNVDGYLPEGPDGRRWHGLLNELQMLMHLSPVNHERAARGQPPLNSVWFWGGGRAPRVDSPWRQVFSHDAVARGLGRLARIPVAAPTSAQAVVEAAENGPCLVVLATDEQPLDTLERAAALERDWCEPLLRALRQRQLAELVLYLGDGTAYQVTPRSLLRFWRRQPILVHTV